MTRQKLLDKKNAYALKTPHVVALSFIYGVEYSNLWWPCYLDITAFFNAIFLVFLPVVLLSFFFSKSQKSMEHTTEHFWPRDLDLWPMTLTYELDLDILPLDVHAKIQVCMSVRSAVRVRRKDGHTHTQTHRQCQNYYTRHVSETWGVISGWVTCDRWHVNYPALRLSQ